MIPKEINRYPSETITKGVNRNGISSITFSISGIPKITGSLTPNNPLGKTILEKAR